MPGRNMMFLLIGGAYAYQVGAAAVAIGLLNEASSIFPDQTKDFTRDDRSAPLTDNGPPIGSVNATDLIYEGGCYRCCKEPGKSRDVFLSFWDRNAMRGVRGLSRISRCGGLTMGGGGSEKWTLGDIGSLEEKAKEGTAPRSGGAAQCVSELRA